MIKNLFLLIFCLQATLFFGQTKFSNEKLALVNDIFYKTTKQTVSSFMKDKGFGDPEVETEENGDVFYFDKTYHDVEVMYNTEGKIMGVILNYGGAMNNAFIEMELQEEGFVSVIDADNKEEERKEWKKPGSKYTFLTFTNEKGKYGTLFFFYDQRNE